jgi:peptidoglycan/LPS O-acetylase OafA/YrhL
MNDLYNVTIANGTGAHFAWHSDHRLVFGAVVAVMTLASLFARPAWRGLVGNPILVWFSLISYNLYMWHVPVKAQCAQTGFPCSSMPAPWSVDPNWNEHYFWSYVLISVAIATLVTFGVERPLLRFGWSGMRRSAPISTIETAWSRRRKEPVLSGDR